MESNKKTIKIIAITAVITCLLTNTVRDIMYVNNNGVVNNKVKKVADIINTYGLFDI